MMQAPILTREKKEQLILQCWHRIYCTIIGGEHNAHWQPETTSLDDRFRACRYSGTFMTLWGGSNTREALSILLGKPSDDLETCYTFEACEAAIAIVRMQNFDLPSFFSRGV
jgi:hypothetical protein